MIFPEYSHHIKRNNKKESAHKQKKKNMRHPLSYWWKNAPHQPIKKLYGMYDIWLLRGESCGRNGSKRQH